ncbi:MAG: N-acetyl-gamma-glutamyl-phosphate reductase [Proteobacteria bacterium]|jgi:N-acetyl-gamma-glutamyl-phosphate reductase|nr:N-acetyl-gamma-glutamyl-phosphate reductase [Pseudomonadota bacterium]MBT5226366.1 N-acetyl-gamma-glutamyl-phosphate reductase [Pseudomonadota bacterium]MBT5818988.1 N-acetyl-gamma-glutamyl-phosphate reductase [Pseudomonadota bacterium]MBT6348277.1 N-acetyl-gamma-glutamyl-phosphate reductase [Pseudomonadota bacterium]|tara:strand:- start:743 stop:1774 length:1032 start_codon:yes stop_codon:yes gene_type:complete
MIKAGIIGGTGYTGVELLRLLIDHPRAEVVTISSRSEKEKPVTEVFPSLRGYTDLRFCDPDDAGLEGCDVVFAATPNGVAMTHARVLMDEGVRLIDLSADFRIRDVSEWARWYQLEHACPELVAEAVYGLPEINRERIRDARLVANPGCYPTSVILGLTPLLEEGLVNPKQLIADAKSGVSGAGRGASVATLLCETSDSFKAYAAPGHRHLPEICQVLTGTAGEPVGLTFVPHLVPMIRGIESTLYGQLNDTSVDLTGLYQERYAGEPFVDVMPEGSHPDTRSVRGSNTVRIACHRPQNGNMAVILVVEDNLIKGAAGQAIQNMNLMFGFEETEGLKATALWP